MRIHLIAIGGAVMHNLAIALARNGHTVTGSDDEIYNPSRDRLRRHGLLPKTMGWDPARITRDLDLVIVGKHARADNPELLRAEALGIPARSFPEFIYEHSKDKTRVVVTGSHGKTTTTAMIMHVLRHSGTDFDYLVGSRLQGFDTMVRLSDAPVMVIEGDEYPASPRDLRPKMLFYKPNIAVTTGIAWDHINVFPTFEDYVHQFGLLLDALAPRATWIYYGADPVLRKLARQRRRDVTAIPYRGFRNVGQPGETAIRDGHGQSIPLQVFGRHNLQNLKAAYYAVKALGLSDRHFFEAVAGFSGTARRLEVIYRNARGTAYLDFAHAPSKLRATVQAVRARHPGRPLTACFELHTFSSLNKDFLPHYRGAMAAADRAFVFYSPHTLKMKRLPHFSPDDVRRAFGGKVQVFTDRDLLEKAVLSEKGQSQTLLLMSSGTFDGMDTKALAERLFD